MSLQDDVNDAGPLNGPVTDFDDRRSRTLQEFRAIERMSKAKHAELRQRGLAPDELRDGGKWIRITYAAHVAWRERMAEQDKSEAAALEQQRRHKQAVEAGRLAAQSPKHYCRRGRAK
jgi:hypothetical protein